ncbi:amylo-alpha-1,6-glucosidase [Nocardia sp. NPDC051321]|uniref:amylo-alpha-1,6-glucosidase n=1 Tax=Nocardia sp. NPDC051321 TaxID=3364323 RepID=UPI0037B18068
MSTFTTDIAESARSAAISVLAGNRRQGRSSELALDYDYTCPSPESYPFQWNWDSCFHAIALTQVDTERARSEITSLLRGADRGGFLPHMLLWQDDLRERAVADFRIALWGRWRTPTIAPPVLARAVHRVHAAGASERGNERWLASVLPAVVALFDWLAERRAGPDGLLVIFQPDESGLDSSPKYDGALGLSTTSSRAGQDWHQAMRELISGYPAVRTPDQNLIGHRRFAWIDVLVNTIYADGLRCLAQLAGDHGQRFRRRADQVLRSLLHTCWDERRGVFWDIDALTGDPAKVLTASSLFPLVLPDLPGPVATRLVAHLLDENEFWLPHPVPSVAASEPSFDADFATGAIFRGSSWVNLNWYLHRGLRVHGRNDIAAELASRTARMAAQSGMRECYGPLTATGHGAQMFGWSSLVHDMLAA